MISYMTVFKKESPWLTIKWNIIYHIFQITRRKVSDHWSLILTSHHRFRFQQHCKRDKLRIKSVVLQGHIEKRISLLKSQTAHASSLAECTGTRRMDTILSPNFCVCTCSYYLFSLHIFSKICEFLVYLIPFSIYVIVSGFLLAFEIGVL
jgi:hypothetical protein